MLIVCSLIFLAGIQTGNAPIQSSTIQPSVSGIHRTYWLTGDLFFNWNGSKTSPGPLVTGSDGDRVTIMLLSNESAIHDWYLDFNNNYQIDPNETATASPDFSSRTIWTNFTFPAVLSQTIPHGGSFTYRCKYHLSMFGNFKFIAGPVSSFVYSPSTPLVQHAVSLDGSASWPSTGARILTYKWDFGDGNTTSSPLTTITHSYSTAGNYSLRLNVTDSASQSAVSARTITIKNAPPILFDYSISLSPSQTTISQGQTATAVVGLSLVSGTPEDVSVSAKISPSDPTIRASLNTSSGFPSFSATMSMTTASSSRTGIYNVTILAVSSSGVAHNATFTLTLNPPSTTPPPNYTLWAAIGGIVTAAALGIVIFRRRSKMKKIINSPASLGEAMYR